VFFEGEKYHQVRTCIVYIEVVVIVIEGGNPTYQKETGVLNIRDL
jgi:hypothetical protein